MTLKIAPKGEKHDYGKEAWSLVPWRGLKGMVRVLEFGREKYGAWNWLLVKNAKQRYLEAAMRHLTARMSGEKYDHETGLSHLAHCMCCLVFIEALERGVTEEPDLDPPSPIRAESPARKGAKR